VRKIKILKIVILKITYPSEAKGGDEGKLQRRQTSSTTRAKRKVEMKRQLHRL